MLILLKPWTVQNRRERALWNPCLVHKSHKQTYCFHIKSQDSWNFMRGQTTVRLSAALMHPMVFLQWKELTGSQVSNLIIKSDLGTEHLNFLITWQSHLCGILNSKLYHCSQAIYKSIGFMSIKNDKCGINVSLWIFKIKSCFNNCLYFSQW